MGGDDQPAFRVGFVPGVTLTKWSRVWRERHPGIPIEIFHVEATDPIAPLRQSRADVVFARLPILRDGFNVIPLYEEQPVVVLAEDHRLTERTDLTLADLDGEIRFDLDATLGLPAVVETVETGAGVAVMPQSLARLYGRKGVTTRPVTDLPPTTIALVWPEVVTTDDIEDFIGIVRGRTANSSRDRREAQDPPAESSKRGTPPGRRPDTAKPARPRGPQRGAGRGRGGGPRRSGRR